MHFLTLSLLNRELKLLFDANNISIPFPQVVVNEPTKLEDANLSNREEKEAKKFVEEQQEISKELEEVAD